VNLFESGVKERVKISSSVDETKESRRICQVVIEPRAYSGAGMVKSPSTGNEGHKKLSTFCALRAGHN